MQLKQFLALFLYINFFSNGIILDIIYKESIFGKKEIPALFKEPCRINGFYDSLVKLKTDNILLYKEINTPSGNKGLIIWKNENCLHGVKFTEDIFEGCKEERISANNQKLGLIGLKFFYGGDKNYSVTKSKIEAMHDFKIEIRAIVNGKEIKSEFFDSSVWNKSEFLPEISRLCKDIIYNWQ